MRKRIISIVLAVAMILCLVPFGVMAAENDTSPNVAPAVDVNSDIAPAVDVNSDTAPASNGSSDVAVMVYGELLSDLFLSHHGDFSAFIASLGDFGENWIKKQLANEEVPHVEMYLVSKDTGKEYKLTENGVNASFLTSITYRGDGIVDELVEVVFEYLKSLFEWAVEDIDSLQSLYRIYGAPDVPVGHYTLEVRSLDKDGYNLAEPPSRNYDVEVYSTSGGACCYVGWPKYLGNAKIELDLSWLENLDIFDWGWFDDLSITFVDAEVTMPGVYLDTVDAGVEFTSANLGDQPVAGSEFVMVNRDETVNIIKAAYALGRDTFKNAVSLLGTEGFTWEELSILHNEVLQWDSENKQISLNEEQAYKLLGTYWSLISASAMDPMIDFMSNDTNIRMPAILKASADENGVVHFDPEDNVTLVWSVEMLFKAGGIAYNEIEELGIIEDVFPDPITNGIVSLVIDLGKRALNADTPFWDENGNIKADNLNTWVYPILQNDSVMEYASEFLHWIAEDELSADEKKILELLPKHALLTPKMPAGKYILFETSVPDGYFRSPFFYTIDLTWHSDDLYPRNWYYASVADMGIIAPYFAEDYYTWLRNYDFKSEADKVLNYITHGVTGKLITNTLTGTEDITKYTITFYSNILYNYMGGNLVYKSELDLAKDMTKYLYAYGKSAQNLLVFGDQVAKKSKAVITGRVDKDWIFYNYSTSLRTNSALKTQKILNGVADAIYTADEHPVTTKIQATIRNIANKIDTTNRIKDQVTKIQNAISSVLSKVISSVGSKIGDLASNVIKTIYGWTKTYGGNA